MWSSIGHLVENYDVEVDIVRYPVDQMAPFSYKILSKRNLYNYSEIKQAGFGKFLNHSKPDLIYVAGWADKVYNRAVKGMKNKVPVVVGLDNPWKNTSRQKAGVVLAGASLRNLFSHVWVSGMPQYAFASRLGYKDHQILRGLYVANTERILKAKNEEVNANVKRLLFVGRLVEYKRPHWLLESFIALQNQGKTNGWEVCFIGEGPLKAVMEEMARDQENIRLMPFMQPEDLAKELWKASAFCLPSENEHWGVVIQEAACANLALVLSDSCGAAGKFLIHGYNGFKYSTNKKEELQSSLMTLFHTSDEALLKMGKRSGKLSKSHNQDYWSAQLMSLL